MKPPPLRYARVTSTDEAASLLASENARVLAGGQSLVPMLNFRFSRPEVLVDIARVPELMHVERGGERLVIGAAIVQREAQRSPDVQSACPLIVQALAHVGHVQTRARGTVVGSLAHADPAAELPAVAVTLRAELVACSTTERRAIDAEQFFRGAYMTAIRPDELLVEARFPLVRWSGSALLEVARRPGDFALAGVAVAVRLDADRHVVEARLTTFGIGSRPILLEATAGRLSERPGTIAEAGRDTVAELTGAGGTGSEAEYRRHVAGVLVQRALQEVIDGIPH